MCFMAISMSSVGEGPFKSCAPFDWGVSLISRCISCFGDKFLVGVFVCTCEFHFEVCLFVLFFMMLRGGSRKTCRILCQSMFCFFP